MAVKRMFDKDLIATDRFLDLPDSSKALYFLLGVEADDEGFVSPKRVLRLYQIADDNLKLLIAKGFLIPFESGVVVITDWNQNNYLDKNRLKPTQYQTERKLLLLTKQRIYVLNNGSTDVQPGEERGGENRREKEVLLEDPETEKELKKKMREISKEFGFKRVNK
jgi:hypothetical protein